MDVSAPLAGLLKRDRAIILAALGGATALSWVYLVDMARDMAAGVCNMPGMEGMYMGAVPVWNAPYFTMMVVMWAVMMVGMMVPSAAPAILLYASMHRNAGRTPYMSTAGFVAGYLAVWTAFSVAAVLAQWGLDAAALLSPTMVSTSPYLGAGLLAAAGVYQLTPWKNACLSHCRGPFAFFQQHWRTGKLGAFRMGARHGAYCLACCWAIMGLLFFGGVMNLLWVAAITVFVLLEKAAPFGRHAARFTGVLMIGASVVMLMLR
jgi:predicted metal-binding membrane protein